jgi:hypothetical protein
MLKVIIEKSVLLLGISLLSALVGVPALAADRCTSAAQCHGPLPQICMKCSDGRFGCARWACVRYRCVAYMCSGQLTNY